MSTDNVLPISIFNGFVEKKKYDDRGHICLTTTTR